MKKHIFKSLISFLFLVLANLNISSAIARTSIESCPAGQTISKTFSSTAKWDFCWDVRNEEGVVLSEVYYKPVGRPRRRVLGEASLSQIQTEYDDGSASEFLVTDTGLGGAHLQSLTEAMCQNGQRHLFEDREVLCEIYKPAGYIYRYKNNTNRQGDKLDVFSVSRAGSREFIVRWTFFENGTLQIGAGLTGQFTKTTTSESAGWKVTAANKVMASFVDHFFWRLDFDLASNSNNDRVEQIKSIPSASRLKKNKNTEIITSELAASFNPGEKKFWRVLDASVVNSSNQPISYEMVMLNYAMQNKGNTTSPWLKNDIYITRYQECERFAVRNPTTYQSHDCGEDVSEFVNSEDIDTEDIVVWDRLAHHTLPRDEDFFPVATQWSSFLLLPRDWTAKNRL